MVFFLNSSIEMQNCEEISIDGMLYDHPDSSPGLPLKDSLMNVYKHPSHDKAWEGQKWL